MLDKIRDSISGYLNSVYNDLLLFHLDKEKLIIKGEEIRVVVKWTDLFGESLEEMSAKCDGDFASVDWDELFANLPTDKKKIDKVILYPNIGFYLRKYAELFFRYNMLDASDDFTMTEFKIGDVEVFIGEPTDIFKFINKNIETDHNFCSWDSFYTIQLNGVEKADLNFYINQAIYLISKNNPSYYVGDFPKLDKYYTEDDVYTTEDFSKSQEESNKELLFQKAKYPEAISFFNAAQNIADIDEIAFLYYYKVLEHFFIVNRKDEIVNLIQNETDYDKLTNDLTGIYKTDEKNLLRYLLSNNNIETQIRGIVKEAFDKKMISTNSIESFTDSLYLHRNSIVHGKCDSGFDVLAPDNIRFLTQDDFWLKSIRKLALICIGNFCYR